MPPKLPDAGETFDAIVDAVSRGRLAPSEVAGLTEGELEALYAAGQACFDTGQMEAAAQLFSALVALMPYRGRPWRALGITLHHRGALTGAAAAYRAALYLEPDHMLTACWAAEVAALLGDQAGADALAQRAWASQDAAAHARLILMGGPEGAPRAPAGVGATARANPDAVQTSGATAPTNPDALQPPGADGAMPFTLSDGRSLPLASSRFPPTDAPGAIDMAQVLALANGREVAPITDREEATATMVVPKEIVAPIKEPTQTRRIVGPLGPPSGLGIDALTARRRGVPLLLPNAEDEPTTATLRPTIKVAPGDGGRR